MKLRYAWAAAAAIFLAAGYAEAQTAAQPVLPGYMTNSGCPSPNQTPCFVQYGAGGSGGGTSGFAPGGAYASLSASAVSSRVALPSGTTVVVYNTGTNVVYTKLGDVTITATTSGDVIQPGSWIAYVVGSNTYIAGITASGTSTLNVSGGTGLPTGAGGGSSGGGGAATIADGADVAEGAKADAAYTGSGSASVIATLKGLYSALTGASTGIAATTPTTNSYSNGTVSNLNTNLNGSLYVQSVPGTTGGLTPLHVIAAASNNATVINGAHTLFALQLGGIGSSPAYFKVYDKATTPTCGTDTPVATYIIPAASTAANGGGSNISIPLGLAVTNGLGYCIVAGIADNDNTAVAAATYIANIQYK